MTIGIDCRLYSQSGIGRYLRNLLSNLSQIDQTNKYFLFFIKEDFGKVNLPKNFHKVLADIHWYTLSEQIQFPKLLYKYNLDLMHFPHFNVPLFYNRPFIVTIHDLIHQHFATRGATTRSLIVFSAKKFAYQKVFSHAVKNSKKIIVPTQFVKDQLVDEWNISKEKIEVTYEAVEESLINLAQRQTEKDFTKVAQKFGIQKPYIFYVGNAQPHKNILSLIDAWEKIKEKYPKLMLVLSGPKHKFWERIKQQVFSHQKDSGENIVFTGYLLDEELVVLYKNCQVFVLPSFEEGFGIPLLEAMACGSPVVCSNIGTLIEVAGDAALYFNPKDSSDLADKVYKVITDKKVRELLIKKGQKRYKQFSWENMAVQTFKIYQKAILV